jgi:hypothetical protein
MNKRCRPSIEVVCLLIQSNRGSPYIFDDLALLMAMEYVKAV